MDLAPQIGRIVAIGTGAIVLLLVLGMIWQALSERAGERKFPAPGRLVDIGGRRMHILSKGDAPGPTVIFEMGAAEPSPFWWLIQDEVAKFARVCTYDRAGFGWSDRPASPPSLEDRAADLHALLKAAQIPGPYVLAGHSLGGPLIRLYARDHLGDTAGLVFVDTPDESSMFRQSYQDFVRAKMMPMLAGFKFANRIGALRLLSTLFPKLSPTPDVVGIKARDAVRAMAGPKRTQAGIDDMKSVLNAPASLRREFGFGGPIGDRPVCVISHGIKFPPPYDVMEAGWDESQANLMALSTNSEYVLAEKSNHMIQIDEPELVIEAIRRVWLAARDGTQLSPVKVAPAA